MNKKFTTFHALACVAAGIALSAVIAAVSPTNAPPKTNAPAPLLSTAGQRIDTPLATITERPGSTNGFRFNPAAGFKPSLVQQDGVWYIEAVPATNAPPEDGEPALPVVPPTEPMVPLAQANAYAESLFEQGVRCGLAVDVLYPDLKGIKAITAQAKEIYKREK